MGKRLGARGGEGERATWNMSRVGLVVKHSAGKHMDPASNWLSLALKVVGLCPLSNGCLPQAMKQRGSYRCPSEYKIILMVRG